MPLAIGTPEKRTGQSGSSEQRYKQLVGEGLRSAAPASVPAMMVPAIRQFQSHCIPSCGVITPVRGPNSSRHCGSGSPVPGQCLMYNAPGPPPLADAGNLVSRSAVRERPDTQFLLAERPEPCQPMRFDNEKEDDQCAHNHEVAMWKTVSAPISMPMAGSTARSMIGRIQMKAAPMIGADQLPRPPR
jgi:hypothetical protein